MQSYRASPQDVRICRYDESFLACSWKWLNDPEVKAFTMTPDFEQAGQRRWFESLGTKTDYLIYGVRFRQTPIGACGLKNITAGSAEYWGYIGEKSFWGCGIGIRIVEQMCVVAMQRTLPRIWLKVSKGNLRAIGLYRKLGFLTDSEEGGNALMSIDLSAHMNGRRPPTGTDTAATT